MSQAAQSTREPLSNGEAAIRAAAGALFAEKGFEAVSVRMVAEKAGVSKANVFHHFGSKEGLYLAVLRSAAEKSTHLLGEVAKTSGNHAEQLCRFAHGHLENLLEDKHVTRLLLREALEHGSERGQELADQGVGDGFTRLVAMLTEAQRSGELRTNLNPGLVAMLMVAANVFYFEAAPVLRHLPDAGFSDDPQDYSEGVMSILLHGILNKKENDK
jgi:TetR/AcrR family transcriptional regulator